MFQSAQNLSMENIKKLDHVTTGRYGEVYRATNLVTGRLVTVREFDEQGHHFGLREVDVLKYLPPNNDDHVLKVVGFFWRDQERILCVVYDFHPWMITLSDTARRVSLNHLNQAPALALGLIDGANPTVMNPQAVKLLLHHFLVAINSFHRAGVIHRRLTPANFLVSFQPLRIRVCDFRSAMCVPVLFGYGHGAAEEGEEGEGGGGHFSPTKKIFGSCLHYSAPELLMEATTYTAAVDVWSVGMIFGWMINGTTLVQQARDEDGQLRAIFRLLGIPTVTERNSIPGIENFQWPDLTEFPVAPPTPLADLIPRLAPAGVALLTRMLEWNPANRITVTDALADDYFDDIDANLL